MRLDIQYVRALLRVFPEDKFEASMQPLNTSFLRGHPLLAEAKQKWSRDVDSAESELHNLHNIFSQRRAALVTEMQAILHDAYPNDNPPN